MKKTTLLIMAICCGTSFGRSASADFIWTNITDSMRSISRENIAIFNPGTATTTDNPVTDDSGDSDASAGSTVTSSVSDSDYINDALIGINPGDMDVISLSAIIEDSLNIGTLPSGNIFIPSSTRLFVPGATVGTVDCQWELANSEDPTGSTDVGVQITISWSENGDTGLRFTRYVDAVVTFMVDDEPYAWIHVQTSPAGVLSITDDGGSDVSGTGSTNMTTGSGTFTALLANELPVGTIVVIDVVANQRNAVPFSATGDRTNNATFNVDVEVTAIN